MKIGGNGKYPGLKLSELKILTADRNSGLNGMVEVKKIKNTIKPGFIKGNIKGAAAAARSAFYVRPLISCLLRGKKLGSDVNIFRELQHDAATYQIKDAYISGGAPKSGEFWTQGVGEAAKKIIKFLAGKK